MLLYVCKFYILAQKKSDIFLNIVGIWVLKCIMQFTNCFIRHHLSHYWTLTLCYNILIVLESMLYLCARDGKYVIFCDISFLSKFTHNFKISLPAAFADFYYTYHKLCSFVLLHVWNYHNSMYFFFYMCQNLHFLGGTIER